MPNRSLVRAFITHPLTWLSILLVGFFYPVFVEGRVLSPADMLFQLPPWDQFRPPGFEHAANSLRSDDVYIALPRRAAAAADILRFGVRLWQDHTFAGGPNTLPQGLGGFFYPPALSFLLLPPGLANTIVMISALFVAGASMYLLLGLLTEHRGARFFGALAWMLNGYFIVWLGATSLPLMFAVLPLLMFLANRFLARRGLLYGLGFATLFGWTLFLSYPPGNIIEGIVLAIYVASIWAQAPAATTVPVLKLTALGLLGLGVGGLPLVTISIELSHLLGSGYRPPSPPLALGNLQTFLYPNAYGNPVHADWFGPGNYCENVAYAGIPTLLCAALGALSGGRRLLREPLLLCALVVGAVSVLASYGIGPLGLAIDALPLTRSIVPARWQVGIDLALCLLATEGFAVAAVRLRAGPAAVAGALVALPMSLVLGRHFGSSPDSFIAGDYILRTALLALAIGALALFLLARVPRRLGGLLLTAVLVADLVTFGFGFNPTLEPSRFYPVTPALAYLRDHADGHRAMVALGDGRLWPGDVLNLYGVDSLTGYDPYRDDRLVNLLGSSVSPAERAFWARNGFLVLDNGIDLSSQAFDLLAVRYAYVPDDAGTEPLLHSDHWRVVYRGLDGRIYENARALPRQFLVREPGTEPVPVDHIAALPDADAFTVEGPGLLVWSRPNDPDWTISVNGRTVRAVAYDGFFQSVPIGPGRDSVEIVYRPKPFYYGALLSLLSLLLVVGLAAVRFRRRCAAGRD